MKKLVGLALLCFVSLMAETQEIAEKDPAAIGFPAPLLPLSPDLPLSLSLSNRERFINNPEILTQEARRNTRIVSERTFPWGLLVGIIGLFFCYLGWKRYLVYRNEVRAKREIITPKEKAVKALTTLEYRPSKEKEFFEKLVNIVRTYIQEDFGIKVYGETTEELLAEKKKYPDFDIVEPLFIQADRVKFAHHQPTKQECEEALATAKNCINTLKP